MTAVETTKERWLEVEVNRVAGEISLKSPKPDAAKAEGYFDRAAGAAGALRSTHPISVPCIPRIAAGLSIVFSIIYSVHPSPGPNILFSEFKTYGHAVDSFHFALHYSGGTLATRNFKAT